MPLALLGFATVATFAQRGIKRNLPHQRHLSPRNPGQPVGDNFSATFAEDLVV